MSDRLSRFSTRARSILSHAQYITEYYKHSHIETEHMLLGLYDDRAGNAGQLLRELGIVHDELTKLIEMRGSQAKSDELDLSSDSKQALVHAVDEARRLGIGRIGSGCLLLGILRLQSPNLEQLLQAHNRTSNELLVLTRDAITKKTVSFDDQFYVMSNELVEKRSLIDRLFLMHRRTVYELPEPEADEETIRRIKTETFAEFAQHYPNDANIQYRVGYDQFKLDNYIAAIAYMDRVLEIDHTYSSALRLRGEAKHRAKDFEGALVDLITFLSAKPEDGWVHYIRGETYRGLGQRDLAVADFHKALERADTVDVKDLEKWKQGILHYIAQGEQSS